MQGNVEMLDFEEGRLDTGNMSYRAILGRMGHAALPSFVQEKYLAGVKVQFGVSLLGLLYKEYF